MKEKEIVNVKVLILGSGPAGITAAIYAARARLETVVLTGPSLGGRASLAAVIDNYPGVTDNPNGTELMARFISQAENLDVKLDYDTSIKVNLKQRPFMVETEGNIYHAENLIITTGSRSVPMSVPGEKELVGYGVSYCATCDGFFYKDKKVAVFGGNNEAVDEAIFLTTFASSVTIINRTDKLRGDTIRLEKAENNPKIHYLMSTSVTEVLGTDHMTGLKLKDLQTGEIREESFDAVFVYIGQKPVSELYDGQLNMEKGLILIDDHMHTNIPGVYAAGESVDGFYKQVVVSAGSGAMAAISLVKDLA